MVPSLIQTDINENGENPSGLIKVLLETLSTFILAMT